jgi:hypothetical protein
MRIGWAIAGCVLLLGCGEAKGPLLHVMPHPGAANDAGTGDDASDSSSKTAISQDMAWQYQLVGSVDTDLAADLFVIDLFEIDDALIADLHMRGKVAVAYLSAGTLEPYRSDASSFPRAAVGKNLSAYPNESWLDVRDETVRTLMANRIALASDKGFDGVLPTNLSGYKQDTGFDLSVQDQDDYAAWLAQQAHAHGLWVGMSSDFARAAQLAEHFDGVMDFGCIARDDCDQLEPFRVARKPRFDVETSGDSAAVCASAADRGVNAILKRNDFGAFRVGCR